MQTDILEDLLSRTINVEPRAVQSSPEEVATGRANEPARINQARLAELTVRALLDAPRDVFMVLSPEGVIELANPAVSGNFGIPVEELTGRNIFELMPPAISLHRRGMVEQAIATGEPVYFSDQSSGRYYNSAVYPVAEAGRPASRIIVYARDVTDSRRLEEELRISHENMERRVAERTSELRRLNRMLRQEAGERRKAEVDIRRVSRQLLASQEGERQRLSRDLHEDVAQNLTSLKLLVSKMRQSPQASGCYLEAELAMVARGLQETIDAVRGLSFELLPPVLEQFGLVEAVSQLCHNAVLDSGRHGGKARRFGFTARGMDGLRLSFETQVNIYRLVQEGLSNVRKHAQARNASVELAGTGRTLTLRISDDGAGFDPSAVIAHTLDLHRMGLWSMKSRVELMRGVIEITSEPGKGTAIAIAIPIDRRSAVHGLDHPQEGTDTAAAAF